MGQSTRSRKANAVNLRKKSAKEIGIYSDSVHSIKIFPIKQILSEERAKAVADYLIAKGVNTTQITSKGFGSSRPLVTDDSPEAHDRNRRVEFYIR